MRSRISVILIILIVLGVLAVVSAAALPYFGWLQTPLLPGETRQIVRDEEQKSAVLGEKEAARGEVPFVIEEIARGLEVPWSIAFTSPERILITERAGRVRVVVKGVLQRTPLHTIRDISTRSEEGLMGLTVDPDYATNHYIYLSWAYTEEAKMYVKVARFTDLGDHLAESKVLIERIPAAQYHAGSRLAFGPDGMLYVTTGDATDKALPQSLASLSGKILRITREGAIPADNPFAGSPIWSYGHRNPQGITWDPTTGTMYATEHGPSVFDGPAGGDEVNHIIKGGNYGWPLVSHTRSIPQGVDPLVTFTPAEAPASAMIYSGVVLPQFAHNLFFGALAGTGLMRIVLDPAQPDKILAYEKMSEVQYGRIRAVTEGPDGNIYFSTSNRDGRGSIRSGDDKIMRIRPAE